MIPCRFEGTGFRGDGGESCGGTSKGLRAIAVLIVIAAHAGFPFLPGGFVGVDVFFVISGYLIAGLLYREIARHGQRLARRLLVAPRPPDPARRHRRPRLTAIAVAGRCCSLLDARQVVTDALWAAALRGERPLRPAGRRLLRPGPGALAAAALLVARGRGAVLRRLAAAAARLPRPGRARRPGRGARAASSGCPAARVTVLAVLTLASLAWSVSQTAAAPAAAYFSTFDPRLGARHRRADRRCVPPGRLRRIGRASRLEALAARPGARSLVRLRASSSPSTPFPGYAAPARGRHRAAAAGRRDRVAPAAAPLLATAPLR